MYMAHAKMQYGAFKVTSSTNRRGLSSTTHYYIERNGEEPVKLGTGKDGKKLARTLAAALEAAGVHNFDCLPPGLRGDDPQYPHDYSDDEWEAWASDNEVVPVRIASGGKAAIAAYLKVVHREREKWIASRLGVSETTVRQYLSDLREGRR